MDDLLRSLFGAAPLHEGITTLHMAGRALIVYLAGLALVRVGKNRLLGRTTAFDIILAFLLGSLLSRAINGGAPMAGTLVAAAVLVALHWIVALVAVRSQRFDWLLKGRRIELVRDGEVDRAGLRRAEISRQDLMEALRLQAGLADPDEVAMACLERNGEISVVARRR